MTAKKSGDITDLNSISLDYFSYGPQLRVRIIKVLSRNTHGDLSRPRPLIRSAYLRTTSRTETKYLQCDTGVRTEWSFRVRPRPLKIATFNINNINKRLHNLTAWLARAQPDVVCLQELKVEQRAFPASALRELGYRGVWLGERSWNGVAILARECDPVLTRSSLPGNPKDRQARYIEAAVNGVLITSIYLPNGNPHPGPKFDFKLAWFERLIDHGAELIKAGVPVVFAGDYNVVPTVQDIYPTRSLDNNALIQPQSRHAYARLLAQGWTDALRKLQPEGPLWTFWDYERNRWALDKGMRLDHFLLSPTVRDRLARGGVDRWVRGEENASDHAPAWIVLDP